MHVRRTISELSNLFMIMHWTVESDPPMWRRHIEDGVFARPNGIIQGDDEESPQAGSHVNESVMSYELLGGLKWNTLLCIPLPYTHIDFFIIFASKGEGEFRTSHMQVILVIVHYWCQSCYLLERGSDCLLRVFSFQEMWGINVKQCIELRRTDL